MRRGDIVVLRLPEGIGHEQRGPRFGVIVQSDAFLPRSVVLVVLTSAGAKPASFRPEVEIDGVSTRVLVEQTGAVDISRLGDLVARLTPEEQWGVDTAFAHRPRAELNPAGPKDPERTQLTAGGSR